MSRTYLKHAELLKGGRLELKMGPQPNKKWGSGPDDVPYSMSRKP
jgi:putative alpha-1,2-mannosidase